MKGHSIFRIHYLFRVLGLCPSSLVWNSKWQLCDKGVFPTKDTLKGLTFQWGEQWDLEINCQLFCRFESGMDGCGNRGGKLGSIHFLCLVEIKGWVLIIIIKKIIIFTLLCSNQPVVTFILLIYGISYYDFFMLGQKIIRDGRNVGLFSMEQI